MTNGSYLPNVIKDAATALITRAYQKTNESFAHFVGAKVQFASVELLPASGLALTGFDERLLMIISNMKGSLNGASYLFLSEKDASQLLKAQLGDTKGQDEELLQALSMELANILTASFVTVLANELQLQTYAYIPKLKRGAKMSIFSHLKSDEVYAQLNNWYKVKFEIPQLDVEATLVWAFDHSLNNHLTNHLTKSEV